MAAALAEARRSNLNVAIAIVDGGGHLVAFERMDGAGTAVIDVALGKARTAAGFGVPSAVVAGFIATSPALLSVDGVVPIRGAVPIIVGGKVVGAIGVSGAPSAEDERIAMVGAATVKE
jgi:glc operon protein GlcG